MSQVSINKLTEFFEIDKDGLYNVMSGSGTNSFIAGGAALQVFNNDEFTDQDLDIFIKLPFNQPNYKDPDYHFEKYLEINEGIEDKVIKFYENFFAKHNYHIMERKSPGSLYDKQIYDERKKIFKSNKDNKLYNDILIDYNNISNKYIKNIRFYKNSNNKIIQLITIFNCITEEFIKTFDLNICMITIIPYLNDFYYYHTINLYLNDYDISEIKAKRMSIINEQTKLNLPSRIIKYKNRGYVWIDKKHGYDMIEFMKIHIDYCKKIAELQNKTTSFSDDFDKNIVSYFSNPNFWDEIY